MKLDSLEPAFRDKIIKLIDVCHEMGINLIPTSCRRTLAEQATLYAQGRTAPGAIVTNAMPGSSAHNFGMACDLCVTDQDGHLWWEAPDDTWHVMADTAVSLGLNAGYFFKSIVDKPHIESNDWKEARDKWKSGELEVV